MAGFELQNGTVVLNTLPIVADVLRLLGADGLVDRAAQLPAFGGDEPPPEQIQRLADALGIEIPPDFGQIEVFSSDDLQSAQDALELFRQLVVAILVATLLLVVLALVVSTRRWRTVAQLGIGVAAGMLSPLPCSRGSSPTPWSASPTARVATPRGSSSRTSSTPSGQSSGCCSSSASSSPWSDFSSVTATTPHDCGAVSASEGGPESSTAGGLAVFARGPRRRAAGARHRRRRRAARMDRSRPRRRARRGGGRSWRLPRDRVAVTPGLRSSPLTEQAGAPRRSTRKRRLVTTRTRKASPGPGNERWR